MKKRTSFSTLRVLALFALLFLSGCTEQKKERILLIQTVFFNIPFECVIDIREKSSIKDEVQAILHNTFQEIDLVYNHWNPNSELSKLNKTSGIPCSVSKKLFAMLKKARKALEDTSGYFNPCLGSQTTAGKSVLKAGILPSHTSFSPSALTISPRNQVTLLKGHKLDLDGIVKGYAVDLIRDQLLEKDVQNFLINWSGELYAAGRHPEGRKWKIYLPQLQKEVELENQALASSGPETQSWTVEGKTYSHFFHPITGQPIEKKSVLSTTVIGPSCCFCDAYATACSIDQGVITLPAPYERLK